MLLIFSSSDQHLTQTAAPFLLEAHKPYYFEFLATHYHTEWSTLMGAKFNASFTDYPYDVDHEQQMIAISSTVIKEQQVRSLGSTSVLGREGGSEGEREREKDLERERERFSSNCFHVAAGVLMGCAPSVHTAAAPAQQLCSE